MGVGVLAVPHPQLTSAPGHVTPGLRLTTKQAAANYCTSCQTTSCQLQAAKYKLTTTVQAAKYKLSTTSSQLKMSNISCQIQTGNYKLPNTVQAAKIQLLNTSCQLQYISLLSGRSCAITPLNITHWLVTTTLLVITTISLLPVLTDYHLISSIYSYILSVLNEYHLITSI